MPKIAKISNFKNFEKIKVHEPSMLEHCCKDIKLSIFHQFFGSFVRFELSGSGLTLGCWEHMGSAWSNQGTKKSKILRKKYFLSLNIII